MPRSVIKHRTGRANEYYEILKYIMKKLSIIIFLIIMQISPASRAIAQDTVSTAGVEFSATTSSSAVSKAEVQQATVKKVIKQVEKQTKESPKAAASLWAIFLAGLLGGFAALLMPCIFPMLPMTVSFFTKGSFGKSKGVGKAMIYGISIIVIYVVLGLAISARSITRI
jgi:thiol:disulfide interchange protein